jgi:hypothetical protein
MLAGIMACDLHGRTGIIPPQSVPVAAYQSSLEGPEIQLVFRLMDECENWNAALALARGAAKCVGTRTSDKSCECQREAPCDLCLFLNDTLRPDVFVRNLDRTHGETIWEDDKHWTKASVGIAASLCSGTHHVKDLAGTLVHEAAHLCKKINGTWATAIPVSSPLAVGSERGDEERARRTEDACGFPNKKERH